MDWYFLSLMFVFGAIVGSFLNVFICRLHTGRSLGGRSHCLSCGTTLSWYELVPILSYGILRGRCTHCSSHISSRYMVVELLTGLFFVFSFLKAPENLLLLFTLLASGSLMITILVYDIMHTIIPDKLVFLLTLCAIAIVIFTGSPLLPNIFSSVAASGFFWFFWFVSKGSWMGLGDAKLAFPLALILGPLGTFSMVVFSFWIGAILSLLLIATQSVLRKGKTQMPFLSSRLTIKSEIPFAPFLIFGFIGAYFFHVDIFAITDIFTKFFLV